MVSPGGLSHERSYVSMSSAVPFSVYRRTSLAISRVINPLLPAGGGLRLSVLMLGHLIAVEAATRHRSDPRGMSASAAAPESRLSGTSCSCIARPSPMPAVRQIRSPLRSPLRSCATAARVITVVARRGLPTCCPRLVCCVVVGKGGYRRVTVAVISLPREEREAKSRVRVP